MRRMDVDEAIEVFEDWFRHLERQKQRALKMQEAANLARNGHHEEARAIKRRLDSGIVVYDGARLEPAAKTLIKAIRDAA